MKRAENLRQTENVVFKPSSIHGLGGFANVDLPAGTRVIEYVGEKIDKYESNQHCSRSNQCIFFLDEEFNLDGSVAWNPARWLNHSCAPNCDAELIDGRIWLVARRDIQAGEEITFNYSYDLPDLTEHPCHCGAANCVGYIVAEEYFTLVRRRQFEHAMADPFSRIVPQSGLRFL